MKALQILGPGKFTVVETEIPKVKDHEVLVEIEIVSTCPRWDINMLGGKDMFNQELSPQYPLPPGFPGHEAAGVVKEVGSAVQQFKVGDRVAALEHKPNVEGAYAEYITYEEYQIIKIPDSISFKQATSLELLKCVVMGLTQFDDIQGKTMLVAGLGPAGILAMQAAKIWGASRVVGIDLSEQRLEYVRGLNIGEVMHADELGEQMFDLGYDCVGFAASVQNVLNHSTQHVVVFGVMHGDVVFGDHFWGRGMRLETFAGRLVSEREKELLIDAVANKGLNTECLQTHHIPFTKYDEVVRVLQSQEAIKVYFYPKQDLQIEE